MSIGSDLKEFREAVEAFLENPIVDHGIDWVGDILLGHIWVEHNDNGKKKRKLNPDWLRRESPRLFAQTYLDEDLLREILYSPYFSMAYRVAFLDNWGPRFPEPNDPADYDRERGEVGPNQWSDIRTGLTEQLVKLAGDEKKDKIKELGEFLTELAQLTPKYRLRRFIRNNYCKGREGDYKIVKFQKFMQTDAGLGAVNANIDRVNRRLKSGFLFRLSQLDVFGLRWSRILRMR